jgi:PAS domain S-box-containing protein
MTKTTGKKPGAANGGGGDAAALLERYAFLAEASELLAESLDYETTLASVARLAVPRLADWCAVDMLDASGGVRRLAVAHVDPSKIELAHELERRYPVDLAEPYGLPNALRTGRPEFYAEIPEGLLESSARDAEHLRLLRELGLRSGIVVPLVARGRTLGAITLVTAESGRLYTGADLEMAEDLARRAAVAVDNASLAAQVEDERRRLRDLVASVPGVMWEAWGEPDEASQRIDFVSDYVEQMLGYTKEEWLSTPNFWLSIVHPDDRERAAAEARRKFESEAGGVSEFRWVRKDGRPVHVAAHSVAVRDERGRAVGMRGVTMDISARKAAEDELSRRVRQAALGADVGRALAEGGGPLREVLQRCAEAVVRHLDAAFARVWTLGRDGDVLELQASAGMYTHTDGAHGRVPVGKFKIGLIAEERQPHLTNAVAGDPRVGDQEWARREGMVAFAGYPLLVEDRLVGVLAMFARRALPEDTMEALASVSNVIAQGIERRRAESEARESAELFGTLANSIPQLAWMADAAGSIFWYNRRWYEYTGTTLEEMRGLGWRKLHHPEEVEQVTRRFQRAVEAGEPWEDTFPLRSRDGEYRRFLSRALPIRDAGGRVVRWFGTNTDVEEQKRAEELLSRLNEERERMLEEVSTPVVPVLEGVLVLPLIGTLDSVRTQRATEAALSAVTRQGARACIIDITGARMVDSHAVANLTNLVQALRLVGAEAFVTGVGAHVAQTLVRLGLDMRGLRTYRTLAQALAALAAGGLNRT